MTVSFLYVASVRILQLVPLSCGEQQDLTIEIVMLRSLSSPRPCRDGIEIWCAGSGPIRIDGQDDRHCRQARSPWSSAWPERTPRGAIAEFKGELATMGVRLAPSSVWETLRRHGIEPLPGRSGPT